MMKKLLIVSLLGLALTACDDSDKAANSETAKDEVKTEQIAKEEAKPKAIKAEDFIKDVTFTKNEKGTVIFNNLVEMLDEMTDYNLEDKTLKIISEKPLSIQIFYKTFGNQEKKHLIPEVQDAFISTVFRIFTYTNLEEITLEIIPVDNKTDKPLNKKFNLKTKVTRAKALEILNTYSAAKTFDDLVNFDENDQYNVIGYSGSKLSIAIRNDKVRDYVTTALKTGKIEIPEEDMQLPFDVDFTNIQVKLKQVFDLSLFDNDRRELADGSIENSTKISDYVKVYAIGNKDRTIRQVAVQFVFTNDNDIIIQSIGGISAAMLATPNPEKAFNVVQTMMDKISKKLKNAKETLEESKVVDGLTLKLKVYPQLGGIAFLTIEKLEKRKIQFN